VSSDEREPEPAPGLTEQVGPRLMQAMKIARRLLPGDDRYGDPLSTVGSEPRAVMARRLGEVAAQRPGILKEVGLSALQVWEAVSADGTEKLGGERLAIVFTDLVGFSDWALEAGDDVALGLLRDVADAIDDGRVRGVRRRRRRGAGGTRAPRWRRRRRVPSAHARRNPRRDPAAAGRRLPGGRRQRRGAGGRARERRRGADRAKGVPSDVTVYAVKSKQ
jgi:hypothetical protein